jgi:CO/xanthine dehydrogenase FAD-binding subunit
MAVLRPRSIVDACEALQTHAGATVLAGGTDLMVALNAGRLRPEVIVSLSEVDELRTWELLDPDGNRRTALRIGAGVTYREIEHGPIAELLPALAQAARTVGSPQIRNAGTIGGNLGTASPAGDTLPVLVALDARVRLVTSADARDLPLADFITGPKRTDLRPDELIESVSVEIPRGPQEFLKVGTRNAMVISVASLAAVMDLDGRTVRIGLGSVGPGPLRAPEAEQWIAERLDWTSPSIPDDRTVAEFGRLVATASSAIDDHRSTLDYRRHAVSVLATRALVRICRSAAR